MNGRALRLVDKTIGSILYGFFYLVSEISMPKCTENNILAIKLWALGESVLILPSIKAIKNKNKRGKIYVLTTKQNKAIFEGLSFVDDIIVLKLNPIKLIKTIRKLRKRKIGICIDFEPYTKFSAVMSYLSGAKMRIGFNNRPRLYTKTVAADEDIHAVKNFINLINASPILPKKIKYPEKLIPLSFTKENEKEVQKELHECNVNKIDKLVGMHAGSASSSLSRRWDEINFAELCDKLIEKYKVKIILVGCESDINKKIISKIRNKDNVVDLSDKLELKELFALMKKLKLFIANDSGPMHIAAAMNVRTIGLFGPNLPKRYGPYGKKNIGLYKGDGIPAVRPFKGVFGENQELKKISVGNVMDVVKRMKCIS